MSLKVIAVGEVLWDLLPSGPQLGGAPANFACHVRQLGADARLISRVGNDPRGHEIIRCIRAMGMSTDGLQLDGMASTGTVSVSLSDCGVPEYSIQEDAAWDHIKADLEVVAAARAADAIYYGTLAQRGADSREAIQRLVSSAPANVLRVCDINLRQRFYNRQIIEQSIKMAHVLKLNHQELAVLSPIFGLGGGIHEEIEQLAGRFGLKLVALTQAEHGSLLYQAGSWSERPGSRTEVVDTVGAGDAFTAGLVMGVLQGLVLEDIHNIAAEMAGFVCSCRGATPTLPAQLRTTFLPGCANSP